jgi:hypothetical protein
MLPRSAVDSECRGRSEGLKGRDEGVSLVEEASEPLLVL